MTTLALESASRSHDDHASDAVATPSRARQWAGRILTGLLAAFLLFDAGCKILKAPEVLEACAKLGWAESTIVSVGALLLTCTTLYLVPRTAVLGAVLLTGYFGGAISLHVQVHAGAFPIAFAFVFGVVTWVSLYLRGDPRVLTLARTLVHGDH